jgi:hypothetical protein
LVAAGLLLAAPCAAAPPADEEAAVRQVMAWTKAPEAQVIRTRSEIWVVMLSRAPDPADAGGADVVLDGEVVDEATGAALGYRSLRVKAEIDCAGTRERVTSLESFAGHGLAGARRVLDAPAAWSMPTEGGYMHAVIVAVCGAAHTEAATRLARAVLPGPPPTAAGASAARAPTAAGSPPAESPGKSAPTPAVSPAPQPSAGLPAPSIAPAPLAELASASPAPTPPPSSETTSPVAASPAPEGESALPGPDAQQNSGLAPAPNPTASPSSHSAPSAPTPAATLKRRAQPGPPVAAQLGALPSEAGARERLRKITLPQGLEARIEKVGVGGKLLYRALVVGFADKASAAAFCKTIPDCWVH